MANDLIFTAPDGGRIVFDDFEDETKEYGTYWTNVIKLRKEIFYENNKTSNCFS